MSMLPASMDEDLEGGAKESMKKMEGKQEQLLDAVDLAQYAVRGTESDWDEATRRMKTLSQGGSGTISIESKGRAPEEAATASTNGSVKKQKKRRGSDAAAGEGYENGGGVSPRPSGGKAKKNKKRKS